MIVRSAEDGGSSEEALVERQGARVAQTQRLLNTAHATARKTLDGQCVGERSGTEIGHIGCSKAGGSVT